MRIKRKLAARKPKTGPPWWQLGDKCTLQERGWFWDLSLRSIYRMRDAGVDINDCRAVMLHMEQSARASRGPIRQSLQRWLQVQSQRMKNRVALLGGD